MRKRMALWDSREVTALPQWTERVGTRILAKEPLTLQIWIPIEVETVVQDINVRMDHSEIISAPKRKHGEHASVSTTAAAVLCRIEESWSDQIDMQKQAEAVVRNQLAANWRARSK